MAAKWKLKDGVTWKDKLEETHPNHGKIVRLSAKQEKRFGKGTMLIPKPLDVVAAVRKTRRGRLMTVSQLREKLARDAGATCSCPMTTGIFLRIAAEAAEEARREGKKRITPYWRVVKDDGGLNDKFPGGTRAQAARLREEGFSIQAARGKQPPRVKDFEKHLART